MDSPPVLQYNISLQDFPPTINWNAWGMDSPSFHTNLFRHWPSKCNRPSAGQSAQISLEDFPTTTNRNVRGMDSPSSQRLAGRVWIPLRSYNIIYRCRISLQRLIGTLGVWIPLRSIRIFLGIGLLNVIGRRPGSLPKYRWRISPQRLIGMLGYWIPLYPRDSRHWPLNLNMGLWASIHINRI